MKSSIPVLDVYYIDLNHSKPSAFESLVHSILNAAQRSDLSLFLASLALSTVLDLTHLIQENRFHVITSHSELNKFENANENDWVLNDRAVKQKQYYIRHPKSLKRNLLIESNSFYNYIEEEQKDELVDFILSHCPAKSIRIDRSEIAESSGKAKVPVNNLNSTTDARFSHTNDNHYFYKNPNGTMSDSSREDFLWLDKSLMRSISALSQGSSLTQTYKQDFTFGLSMREAKTVGLDINHHKRYLYTIEIKC